ncbi:hypothetical protein LEP1GSC062_2899 [Leptospira alexanderi serovar Manhao 3 str. L 60]|uniref:Uncharacterized protein n=1 Tax=Leptospira alexanderi serovar Manhao 3 str. L 60 TaxID=1049759 RepID=V6I6G2_9LEPT|nr:hypothetical protein LEP1GSC062_2899 [Leptospira alexanderi serovar Manhao 3 str. L 60]
MTTVQKIIKNKVGLLKLAETLENVSKTCNVTGYSRDRNSSRKYRSWKILYKLSLTDTKELAKKRYLGNLQFS